MHSGFRRSTDERRYILAEKYIALIPAYEPNQVMINLILQLYEKDFEIIVVDDGSGSDYKNLFEEASSYATILTQEVNCGKGSALKAGMSYIYHHFEKDTVIVTVDADGQHCIEDVIRICDCVKQYPDALLLGSRKLNEHVPLRSQFGNTITRFVYRLSTGLNIYDTQTGLRAFSKKLIPDLLEISGERYEYEMNVLLEFAKKHIPIQEIEIKTIYIDDNATSHFKALKDSYRIYKEILKFSASSFCGFLVDYAMYSMLLMFTGNLRFANIGARVVSAIVNYNLNRQFVFKNKDNIVKSALQYFLLAVMILIGNTIVLEQLVNGWGIHKMFAKILTECLFFLLSWLVQRCIIFRKREKKGEN